MNHLSNSELSTTISANTPRPAYWGWLLGLLLLLAKVPGQAQAPAWQASLAVRTLEAASDVEVHATATDSLGNVYFAGHFAGRVTFGNRQLTSVSYSQDLFVAKYNPTTNSFDWVQQAGGDGEDRATAIAVSSTGIYITGYFQSYPIQFGSTTLYSSFPLADIFVARLTDHGTAATFDWAQQAGGKGQDKASALAVRNRSVYITGNTSEAARFGSVVIDPDLGNYYHMYVAKLVDDGPNGHFVWVKTAGSLDNGIDEATALAVSGGSVYLAGNFALNGGVPYGTAGIPIPARFDGITLLNFGYSDIFVAKLTDTGPTASFTWVQQAGGPGVDEVAALTAQGPNVYLAGQFRSPEAKFGALTIATASTTSPNGYVAKLVDGGAAVSVAWVQLLSSATTVWVQALAVQGTAVYVAGDCGGATFGTLAVPRTGQLDSFLAKLTDGGGASRFAWVLRGQGTDANYALGVAAYGTQVYVCGKFASSIAFGSQVQASTTGSNKYAGFVAVVGDTPLPTRPPAALAAGVRLYPNPAREEVTISIPAAAAGTAAVVRLYTSTGQLVRREAAAPGLDYHLALGGLAPGLYALQVEAGAPLATYRLLVE